MGLFSRFLWFASALHRRRIMHGGARLFEPQVPGLETSVSLLVMNSSSTGMPSLVF
jgi:hypothetical protein